MSLISYTNGQASVVLRVKLRQDTTGAKPGNGITALTSSSAGLIISTIADNEATATTYTQAGSTIEAVTTLGTFLAPTATKCRFKKVDDTNNPGIYEIQIADARFAVSSAKSLLISISGVSGMSDCDVTIPLQSINPYDAVHGGMTALPNAAANAAGGLPVSIAGALDLDEMNADIEAIQTGVAAIPTGVVLTSHFDTIIGTPAVSVSADIAEIEAETDLIVTATNTGVAPGASGGLLVSGSNAGTTTLAALTVTGSLTVSDGLLVSRTTSNSSAIVANGAGAGHGMELNGGNASGSRAAGNGFFAIGGTAFTAAQNGAGAGFVVQGGGGAASGFHGPGVGFYAIGGNGNGVGGAAHGMFLQATSAGTDLVLNQTSTNMVLAKTTNITGFNDIAATDVVSSGAITTSGGKVSEVALVDTLTTYTGNTPQTGDGYLYLTTNLGALGANATALASATNLAEANADLDELITSVAAIPTGVVLTSHFDAIIGTPAVSVSADIAEANADLDELITSVALIPTTPVLTSHFDAIIGTPAVSVSADIAEANADLDELIVSVAALGTPVQAGGNVNVVSINGSTTAAITLGLIYTGLETGTAQSGGAQAITLRAGAIGATNYWENQAVFIIGGSGAGQTNRIVANTNQSCLVESPWVIQPDNTSIYVVLGRIG